MIDSEKQHDLFWGDDVVGESSRQTPAQADLRPSFRFDRERGRLEETVLPATCYWQLEINESRTSELQRLSYTPRFRGSELV